MRRHLDLLPRLLLRRHIHLRTKTASSPPPPPPPNPPHPPQKPEPVTIHGETWQDSYAWMGSISDAAAMRHMDVHMEAEEKYAEACLAAAGADRLARKLQLEMASRLASEACTTPARWGPWLYYRRADEGKQYPVLCRRSAALHGEFISYSDPSAGFDFTAGNRIEQKLVDYNKEAERFGGYSYEELSEVSPDHRYIAYTMNDKDKDSFTLLVKDLVTGTLCDKPRADRVSNISWAMDGKALIHHIQKTCGLNTVLTPTIIYEDNAACVAQVQSGYVTSNLIKHINPKFFYEHELQKMNKVRILHTKSCENLADLFTKSLPASSFERCVRRIGMMRLRDMPDSGGDSSHPRL